MSSPVVPTSPVGPVSVAFAMPEETFRRIFDQSDLQQLRSCGSIRLIADGPLDLDDPAHSALLARAEVLITGWGTPPLDRTRLDRLTSIRAIAHSAGSIRPVVGDDVWARGLAVTSSASANAVPVAEYTVAMIVLAAKRAFAGAEAVRDGVAVDLEASGPSVGMHGITVGVIGASRVGRAVIERLHAHDVRIVVSDPYLDEADAAGLGATKQELHELAATSDIITLHAPLIPATEGMIDRAFCEAMRPGSTFINTARGAIVDQDALADRLHRGDIAAVLDVTEPEQLPADARLRSAPHVFITPHIAGSMGNELRRLAENAVRESIAYATTGVFLEPIAEEGFVLQA